MVATGIECALLNALQSTTSKVRIRVSGVVGVDGPAAGLFTLRSWDGSTETDLTPAGNTEICATSNNVGSAQVEVISFEITHTPGTTTPLTYRLYWRREAANIHLGRRGVDTLIDCPTTMTVEEII